MIVILNLEGAENRGRGKADGISESSCVVWWRRLTSEGLEGSQQEERIGNQKTTFDHSAYGKRIQSTRQGTGENEN